MEAWRLFEKAKLNLVWTAELKIFGIGIVVSTVSKETRQSRYCCQRKTKRNQRRRKRRSGKLDELHRLLISLRRLSAHLVYSPLLLHCDRLFVSLLPFLEVPSESSKRMYSCKVLE